MDLPIDIVHTQERKSRALYPISLFFAWNFKRTCNDAQSIENCQKKKIFNFHRHPPPRKMELDDNDLHPRGRFFIVSL